MCWVLRSKLKRLELLVYKFSAKEDESSEIFEMFHITRTFRSRVCFAYQAMPFAERHSDSSVWVETRRNSLQFSSTNSPSCAIWPFGSDCRSECPAFPRCSTTDPSLRGERVSNVFLLRFLVFSSRTRRSFSRAILVKRLQGSSIAFTKSFPEETLCLLSRAFDRNC